MNVTFTVSHFHHRRVLAFIDKNSAVDYCTTAEASVICKKDIATYVDAPTVQERYLGNARRIIAECSLSSHIDGCMGRVDVGGRCCGNMDLNGDKA